MLKVLITKFWPVLIPIAAYLIWLAVMRRRAEAGKELPKFGDGPFKHLIVSIIIVSIACFIWLFYSIDNYGGEYVKGHMEKGEYIRGHFK